MKKLLPFIGAGILLLAIIAVLAIYMLQHQSSTYTPSNDSNKQFNLKPINQN